MKYLTSLIVLIVFVVSSAAHAQAPDFDCDLDAIRDEYVAEIEAATTLDELNQAHTRLGARLTYCRLHASLDTLPEFSGSGDEIVGPLEIEPGYYEIEYTATSENGRSNLELDFQHENDHFTTMQLNSYGIYGRELAQLTGGTYFINVETANTWSLSITTFDSSTLTDAMILSSDSLDDYVGPFEIAAGFYLLEYEGEIDPEHPWSGGHFYAQIRTASDLRQHASVMETVSEAFGESEIFHLDAGLYVITVAQDGLRNWTVKLSSAD